MRAKDADEGGLMGFSVLCSHWYYVSILGAQESYKERFGAYL